MPQVTIWVYMACINNVYNPPQTGDRVHHIAIAFLLKRIRNWMECMVCVLCKFPFSYTSGCIPYPCALIQLFIIVCDAPCSDTGMWMVKPEMEDDGTQVTSIICVKSILQGAHLIGVYGRVFLPHNLSHSDSLMAFQAYYVNKFIDYHANEIAY